MPVSGFVGPELPCSRDSGTEVAIGQDRDAVAGRRELETADIAFEVTDLHRRSANRHAEKLVLIAHRHQEPDRPVGSEDRIVALLGADDGLGRCAAFREVEQIERVDALVLVPVRVEMVNTA